MLELGFTDGFEIASGLVQAFVASVFLRFRSSRQEWGLGWLALSYGAAAALNLHLGLFWSGPALSSMASLHGLDVGDALMGNMVTGALFLYLAWLYWL